MKESGICEVCGFKFGIIWWKRFCAKCKRICCRDCLTGIIKGIGPSYPDYDRLKICSDCVVAESTTQSIAIHEDLELTGQINKDLRLELKDKIMALEKFRTFLLQINSTFGPNSDLFPQSDSPKSLPEDNNCDISELVTKCQEDFENMQEKVRSMRRMYESSILGEESAKSEVERLNRELVLVSSERDSLRNTVSHLDSLRSDIEDQRQQYQDVLKECEKLRIRCRKLELLLRSPKSSRSDISRVLEDTDTRPRRYSRLRFWLSSSCCPRFFR